tara:strand:- start:903 stop:1136 length:234 start_codon:yes stop_codon:yes gene_type:complete
MINIPQDVYEAINNPYEGFDKMYYSFIHSGEKNTHAFESSISRIQEYFPDYQRYSSYESYQVSKNKRRKLLMKNRRK